MIPQNIRRFYLENQNGGRLGLNGEDNIFFNSPSGLGFENNSDYANLLNGFFYNTNEKSVPQSSVTGELIFFRDYPSPYYQYAEFCEWVNQSTNLYLVYEPSNIEYYREVKIQYLTKGELEKSALTIPVKFTCLTPWYRLEETTLGLNPMDSDAIYFDSSAKLLDHAILGSDIYSGTYVIVEKEGSIPASFKFTYAGAIEDPTITVKGKETGTIYGNCSVDLTLSTGNSFILDTRYRNCEIKKIVGSTETDLINSINIKEDPFIRLPITEDCIITLDATSAITGTASINIYHYYNTV